MLSLSLHNKAVLDDLVETTKCPCPSASRRSATRSWPIRPGTSRTSSGRSAVPTLVLCGGRDTQCRWRSQLLIHDHVPGSELVVFAGSSHFPFEEEPERFRQSVAAFLGGIAAHSTETTHA